MVAILIEFHNHKSTGNGGCTTVPSACVYAMPSANCQCSKLSLAGISEPVAKLPGRNEMLTTASSGNSVSASNTHSPACAANTRQRWFFPVTMGMPNYLFASLRCVIFNCTAAITATITKISVEMAAAKPKFCPLSVKAMR